MVEKGQDGLKVATLTIKEKIGSFKTKYTRLMYTVIESGRSDEFSMRGIKKLGGEEKDEHYMSSGERDPIKRYEQFRGQLKEKAHSLNFGEEHNEVDLSIDMPNVKYR